MLAKNLRAPRQVRLPASSLTTIASKLTPTVIGPARESSQYKTPGLCRAFLFVCDLPPPPVGASLLAKNPRTPRGTRLPASSLTTIASKLAPTEDSGYTDQQTAKRRLSAPFCFAFERQAISAVVSKSKVSSPSLMSTCTTPPWSASSPNRISSASGRLILSWIRRAMGRAPIAES